MFSVLMTLDSDPSGGKFHALTLSARLNNFCYKRPLLSGATNFIKNSLLFSALCQSFQEIGSARPLAGPVQRYDSIS